MAKRRNSKTGRKSEAGKAAEQRLKEMGAERIISVPESYLATLVKYLQERPYKEVASLLANMARLTAEPAEVQKKDGE